MNTKVKKLIYSLLLCIATITAAQAVEANGDFVNFVNGSFEEGDSGWVAGSNGALFPCPPFEVRPASQFCSFSTYPIQGFLDFVFNFDGNAGYEAWLFQDVLVPDDVILSLYDRIQYDSLGIPSTSPRVYEIQIRDLDDNLLEVLHHQEVMLDGQPYTDLRWQQRVFDISQYAGQTVRVFIQLSVPQEFTGPATIEFDDFRFIPRGFQNGGFETGDFTGWVATDNGMGGCGWQVGTAVSGPSISTNPIQGTFDAANCFDGNAGYEPWLFQDVLVPDHLILSLYDRIQYDGLDIPSTLPRIYEIQIRDLKNNLLEVLHHQEVMLNGQPYTDLGWQQRGFDISQYAGQTVRVFIQLSVPEDFTGPATIEFDDFRFIPLLADFSAGPTEGFAPLTVNFTDQSIGEVTSWSWDFGDGSTSTEQDPTHIYDDFGTYTVSLTATGPGGSGTETKTKYIFVRSKAMPWIPLLLLDD